MSALRSDSFVISPSLNSNEECPRLHSHEIVRPARRESHAQSRSGGRMEMRPLIKPFGLQKLCWEYSLHLTARGLRIRNVSGRQMNR